MMNAVYALASLPIGILSNRIGKRGILAVGYLIFGLTCIGFALVSGDPFAIAILFVAAGLFMAMVDTMERAYAVDLIPPELRGTGYGALHTVNGVADLPASVIAWAPMEFLLAIDSLRLRRCTFNFWRDHSMDNNLIESSSSEFEMNSIIFKIDTQCVMRILQEPSLYKDWISLRFGES
jgi:MFS family permease